MGTREADIERIWFDDEDAIFDMIFNEVTREAAFTDIKIVNTKDIVFEIPHDIWGGKTKPITTKFRINIERIIEGS